MKKKKIKNSKICLGFIIIDHIKKEDFWKRWMDLDTELFNVLIHSKNEYKGTHFQDCLIDTVENSWEKTLKVHIALYENFLKNPENQKLCILSESCIPLQTPDKLRDILNDGFSYGYWRRPWWRIENSSRKTGRAVRSHLVASDQWVVLDRKDVEVLYAKRDFMIDQFSKTMADNECFTGTILNMFGEKGRMKVKRTTFDKWLPKRRHPLVHLTLEDSILNEANDSFFLRKIDHCTDLHKLEWMFESTLEKQTNTEPENDE